MILKRIGFYLLQDMSYFWSKMAKKDQELGIDDVMSRLRIEDASIIETVYSIYYDLLEKEDKRRSDLDNKAYSLIGIVGVCITLIFGLGGILIEKIKSQNYVVILTILYLGAFLFGMVSLLFALCAAWARSDFKTVNDENIFSEKEIKGNSCSYKRFLIAHYWQLCQNDFGINEKKGKSLKISFRMFTVNIIFLLSIVCVISYYSLTRGGEEMSSCNNKGKPPATSKPTSGKIETADVKPTTPKPTTKPSTGTSITESEGR
jgi:hypothetical protein